MCVHAFVLLCFIKILCNLRRIPQHPPLRGILQNPTQKKHSTKYKPGNFDISLIYCVTYIDNISSFEGECWSIMYLNKIPGCPCLASSDSICEINKETVLDDEQELKTTWKEFAVGYYDVTKWFWTCQTIDPFENIRPITCHG